MLKKSFFIAIVFAVLTFTLPVNAGLFDAPTLSEQMNDARKIFSNANEALEVNRGGVVDGLNDAYDELKGELDPFWGKPDLGEAAQEWEENWLAIKKDRG